VHPGNVHPGQASCLQVLSDHPKMTIEFLRAACRPLQSIPECSSSLLGLFTIPGKAPRSFSEPGKLSALPFQTSEDTFPFRAKGLPGTSKLQKARPKLTGCLPVQSKPLKKLSRSIQKARFERSRIPKIPIPFQQSPCHGPSKPR
jgi:hypothetical protein